MIAITHITPHLGGGIGKALSGILCYEKTNNPKYNHKVIVLDKPSNSQFIDILQNAGIEIIFTKDLRAIEFEVRNSDIVIVHWWHHPLNSWLFANFPQTECRLILWSHINGCTYPMLPFKIVEKVHKAFFTSNYTMYNPYWTSPQQNFAQKHARVIFGLGVLDNLPFEYSFNKSSDFTVGYVGTLNFSKLNPDFADYCYEVVKRVPNTKFVMVGNPDEKDTILEQAKKYNIQDRFNFVGYTNDVNKILKTFDVFGYPLNNWHFGTTENAILEAMNATIPVVALNQCSERYLIKHNETGFLANNKEHYGRIMKKLANSLPLRIYITTNAKKMLSEKFVMQKNILNMRDAFASVLELDKRCFDFKPIIGVEPHEWFLNCLGEDREIFETNDIEELKNCREIYKCESKSSPMHFLRYFPEDKILKKWVDEVYEPRGVKAIAKVREVTV